MENLVSELRKRFDEGVICYASMADGPTFREYTDEEARMIGIFSDLSETVEVIPLDILNDAEQLHAKLPQSFEEILDALIEYVGARYLTGGYFEPSNAAEFVQKLIDYVRLREVNPSLFVKPNLSLPDAVS